jgi:glutamate-1-semialdehyde 2,1-aminomutase
MDHLAPLGPVYQAGTLSGNPLAMAAGIASLQMLDELNPYVQLDTLGWQVCTAALAAAKTKGIPLQAPQAGSMFSLFFTPDLVRDMPTALASDARLFGRFFHACLADGVYLPPSAYESWFLSTAHEGPAIARACEVITKAIKSL